MAIAERVANRTDADPADLPPLYDVVDTTHLNHLIESSHPDLEVEFPYYGFTVSISGDGSVRLTGRSGDQSRADH
ncbi:HalOD1 output domain-containing protein [Halopiger goleimassiliensis]|uniref:HalOD1 output domain-containing protein n=1 Tax=Halopiger goleimassiliensis TaxID=1293048 RepID=UPI000B0DE633